jgi:hypothetical protein
MPFAAGRTFEPDAGRHALHRDAIARQERLYRERIGPGTQRAAGG